MAKNIQTEQDATVVFTTENADMANNKTGEIIGTGLVVNAAADRLQTAKDAFAICHAGQFKRGVALTADYFEFSKVGETSIGWFLGIKEIEITDTVTKAKKPLIAAFWLSEDEAGAPKMYSNGGQQLVEAFKLTVPKTFVEIKYVGKKGNMKKYEITPLIID